MNHDASSDLFPRPKAASPPAPSAVARSRDPSGQGFRHSPPTSTNMSHRCRSLRARCAACAVVLKFFLSRPLPPRRSRRISTPAVASLSPTESKRAGGSEPIPGHGWRRPRRLQCGGPDHQWRYHRHLSEYHFQFERRHHGHHLGLLPRSAAWRGQSPRACLSTSPRFERRRRVQHRSVRNCFYGPISGAITSLENAVDARAWRWRARPETLLAGSANNSGDYRYRHAGRGKPVASSHATFTVNLTNEQIFRQRLAFQLRLERRRWNRTPQHFFDDAFEQRALGRFGGLRRLSCRRADFQPPTAQICG